MKTNYLHTKCRYSTLLSKHVQVIKNRYGVNPILKREIVKRAWNYNIGDKFFEVD